MRVEININTNHLPPHTEEELIEWLRWEMNISSSMSMTNPLADCDLEASTLLVRK